MNRINELKIKERKLHNQLVNLVTSNDINDESIKTINQIKTELQTIANEIKDIEHSKKNWECFHMYKSVNGKVEEVFKINDKEVNKEEYLEFINKNNEERSIKRLLTEDLLKTIFSPIFLI